MRFFRNIPKSLSPPCRSRLKAEKKFSLGSARTSWGGATSRRSKRSFLMGKQYSSEKRTEAFRGNQHTAKKSGSVQSEHNQKPMKTCERIAQENHSSASSVRRAEYYAHGVDVADELSPGFRDRFFREELHIPDYLLENLGKAKPEEQAEIF